jgi:hypothetical protein
VLGCVALAVALGTNASALPGSDRIDRNDLRNRVVGAAHIKTNAVRSRQIADAAVGQSELGTIVERDGPNIQVADAANDGNWSTGAGGSQSVAQCEDGERIIGGTMEWDTDGGVNGDLAIVKMFPNLTTNSWTAVGSNDEGTSETFHAVALCLQ